MTKYKKYEIIIKQNVKYKFYNYKIITVNKIIIV